MKQLQYSLIRQYQNSTDTGRRMELCTDEHVGRGLACSKEMTVFYHMFNVGFQEKVVGILQIMQHNIYHAWLKGLSINSKAGMQML
jgi:esterase/lipase superfamily enzyme